MAAQDINQPHSLPPYPEMIITAIDALNEKLGSNKTSISKFIESKYQNLPAGHSTLLRHHLNRMKDTGELIFWKNNYMKPDPNFIRRGRGRPPKPKEPGMPTSGGPAKPRGRPRKDEIDTDEIPAPVHVPVAAAASSPKKQKISLSEDFDANIGMGSNTKTGRPRGRPPKVKPQMGGEGVSA